MRSNVLSSRKLEFSSTFSFQTSSGNFWIGLACGKVSNRLQFFMCGPAKFLPGQQFQLSLLSWLPVMASDRSRSGHAQPLVVPDRCCHELFCCVRKLQELDFSSLSLASVGLRSPGDFLVRIVRRNGIDRCNAFASFSLQIQ